MEEFKMLETLKNRNFFLIITGKLISLMGNSIFDIAVIWYVLWKYEKTSGTMLALIMLMAILPTVLLGSISGVMVDRYNRKHLMILSDLIAGITVFAVVLLMNNNRMSSLVLLSATGILSVTSSTVRIAVNSMIPELFHSVELYHANGLNQFVERGTALLGYALGGGLIALVGVQNAILLNGVSFIICAVLEAFLKISKKTLTINSEANASANVCSSKNLIMDFKEVKIFLKSNGNLLRVVLVFTVVNFLLDPLLNIVMPYVLKNNFNVNSANFGLIIAALPLGFCIGAIYFSKKPSFLQNKFVLFNSILAINLVMLVLILPMLLSRYFTSDKLVVGYFIGCLLVSGIFSAAINISASTQIQKNVPTAIRGKFMGITSSLSAGLVPLGSLIAGALIGLINPTIIYGFSIIAIFAVIIVVPKQSYSFENTEAE
jgi:MFS transporter, DHA3 family, macrolide efflux protein